MKIDTKLSHLSTEQLENLISRYYGDEKIKDLLEEFKIDCKPGELYQLFPPEEFSDIKCRSCNVPMIKKRVSKNSFIKGTIYCPKCQHKFENINCTCQSCNDFKRVIIHEIYIDVPKVKLEDLNLRDRVYLAAILRGLEIEEVEDKLILLPLSNTQKKIAPIFSKEIEILTYLTQRGIISVNTSSDLDAFTGNLIEENYAEKYYIARVKYTLNMNYSSELTNPKIEVTEDNIDELYELVREISLDECYGYLEYQMKKINFDFNPGKITEEVFNELLDMFSIGQVYCVIYSGATHAARYYQENTITKKQAANSVITRCRGYTERAIANGWTIKAYSRPYDCKQSEISTLLFNRIVRFGDKYLEHIYSYENFKSLLIKS